MNMHETASVSRVQVSNTLRVKRPLITAAATEASAPTTEASTSDV